MRVHSIGGLVMRIGSFAMVMVVFAILIMSSISRPVDGDLDRFTAVFADSNGLRVNDDVRMFGVQVGKVESIELTKDNRSAVRFTFRTEEDLYADSTLAIRYQSLAGQRYIDVRHSDAPTGEMASGESIGLDRTMPAFDITALFNGLEPVLSEFSPATLNTFSTNMLAVFNGEGAGIGPAMDSIARLGDYVDNRQELFSILFANIRAISDRIGGRSPQLVTLLKGFQPVFESLRSRMDSIVDFANIAPPVMGPLNNIARTFGLTEIENPDLENTLRRVFPDPDGAKEQLSRLPGVLQTLNAIVPVPDPVGYVVDRSCSRGPAEIPDALRIVVAGHQVSICRG